MPTAPKTRVTKSPDRLEDSRILASLAAQVCEDLKGKQTVVLGMSSVTPIVDFFVVTTANSKRQMRAIMDEVETLLKSHGNRPRVGVEGRDSESWMLQDYGDIVLHVFSPSGRELYDLERLWADAAAVDWQPIAQKLADAVGLQTGDSSR